MIKAAVQRALDGHSVCIVVNERNQLKKAWEAIIVNIPPEQRNSLTTNRRIALNYSEINLHTVKEVVIDWEKMTLKNKQRELFIDPVVIEIKFYKMLDMLKAYN